MVIDYAAEFERYKGKSLDLVSLETIEGADLAELYGISRYPAILVMAENGSLQYMWQGTPLPLMDELSYQLHTDDTPIRPYRHALILAHA
jgi:hypothetical protein